MKPKARYIWMRLGDSSEYQKYDDIDNVSDMLMEAGVKGPLHQGLRGQVFTRGYEAANYISLYWGDDVANWCRNLSKREMEKIIKVIGFN